MDDSHARVMLEAASAIILAGGRGSRIGQHKAMLRLGGVTLIERTVAELRRAFDDIVVVAAPESEGLELPVLDMMAHDVTMVRDDAAYRGPAVALARGLHATRHEIAFACSCDLPMLRSEVASWLLSLIDGRGTADVPYDAVIPRIGGRLQPLHAAYRRRCAGAVDAMLSRGERRLRAVAAAINTRIVSEAEYRRADPELLSCFNINTPQDYARALKLTAAKG